MRAAATLFACSVLALNARADQNDPALDDLFSALPDAGGRAAAAAIEQQIWALWFSSPGSDAEAELNAARETAQKGRPDLALASFDTLVERYPDYAEGWNQRAIMRYLMGDIAGSLRDIDEVLQREPRHFGALSGRGQCLLREQRYAEALEAFEQALDVNPWIESTARQVQMLRAIVGPRNEPI